MGTFLDDFFSKIADFLLYVLNSVISLFFATKATTLITGFVILNAIGYFLMYSDKKYAIHNGKIERENPNLSEKELRKLQKRRIPERTLMLTALVFGSLGIWAGMYKFSHKTQKPLFKYGVPIIIVIQIIFIIVATMRHFMNLS